MSYKKSQHNSEPKKQGNQLKNVALVSGLAFQMAAITGLGGYIGYKLDEHYQNENNILTILLTFIGFGIAMYGVVKIANKLSNQKNASDDQRN